MESTHESLQTKVVELFEELKNLSSNYKLKKLNMNIVLHDAKNNKNFSFNIDEGLNFSVASESVKVVEAQDGGNLSDSTLSSGIFNTSANSEDTETLRIAITTSDVQSTISENTDIQNKNSTNVFKGGFKKTASNKQSLSNDIKFSPTSELNTTAKNIFAKQKGGANVLSDTSVTSATSDNKVSAFGNNFSATSMSATSDYKTGTANVKSDFSATSDVKFGGGKSEFSATSVTSATSMSATSDYKTGDMMSAVSATSMSATSDNKVGGGRRGLSETSVLSSDNMLSNFSATSLANFEPASNMKGGFIKSNKIESTLSKMDLIRKKIKELESVSESEIFQKNKVTQSGGGKNANQAKQVIGINSSSTSSLCE